MKNKESVCGIYKIISPTGRIYIGQSKNIDRRWEGYKYLSHTKEQPRLHRSFLKYGVYSHTFEVIEVCCENKLNIRERFYQDFFKVLSPTGLNCTLTKTNEKVGYKPTKRYKVVDKQGKLYKIEDLQKFCNENDLNYRNMMFVLCGVRKHYGGWRIWSKTVENSPYVKNKYYLVNPNGIPVVINHLQDFCLENKLKHSCIKSVIFGKQFQHKGWRKDLPENRVPYQEKLFYFVNSSGRTVSTNNLKNFTIEYGLSHNAIKSVNNGSQIEHRGWKLHIPELS